ncbi:hypothetical protein NDU88_003087, partial [Pleurodeles waltl]
SWVYICEFAHGESSVIATVALTPARGWRRVHRVAHLEKSGRTRLPKRLRRRQSVPGRPQGPCVGPACGISRVGLSMEAGLTAGKEACVLRVA